MSGAPLGDEAVARAADVLLAARLENRVIEGIPDADRPRDLQDAYRVQDRFVDALGWTVGGWFAGCTNAHIQRQLGLGGPYTGRIFRHLTFPSPATIATADFPPIVLECEFAFVLREPLPARTELYSRIEVLRAVASVHPAIEVVAGHLADWTRADIFSIIADNGTDGAIVLGQASGNVAALDLASVEISLSVNGTPVQSGSGRDVLGDPVEALVWLVNARTGAGDDLPAGHVLSTGTATAMQPVAAGDHAIADFGSLGRVALSLA